MASYRITYWKDVPSQVEAFEGAERVRRPLDARFQELIDAAAMRLGLFGTDAYLEAWQIGPTQQRDGAPREVADAIVQELEAQFDGIRVRTLGATS